MGGMLDGGMAGDLEEGGGRAGGSGRREKMSTSKGCQTQGRRPPATRREEAGQLSQG